MKRELIKITNLTKKYGKTTALNGISLSINKGDVIGILGPNGAGKTTLISIISALRHPTEGTVKINNRNLFEHKQEIKQMLGIVFQETSLDKDLTVQENLMLHALLYNLPQEQRITAIENAIKEFKLSQLKDRLVKTLSGGERQRVELAKCFLHNPSIFIFDEPTVGLDPQVRREIWDAIKRMVNPQKTIIITSHYLEEIEYLCKRIVIIDHGNIILSDHIRTLTQNSGTRLRIEFNEKTSKKELEEILNTEVEKEQNSYILELNDKNHLNSIIKKLEKKGLTIKTIGSLKDSLESIYLKVLGANKDDNH